MLTKFITALLLFASTASAGIIQTHHERVPEIGADATRNTPNPATANESFRIESGQTVVITGNETVKDIYVNGMGDAPAVLELADGCELRCQTIMLAGPQAVLRTPDNCACRVVWRDLPLDLVNDPQQFGNGLINISGEIHLRGRNVRQSKALVAAEIRAGQRVIELAAPPVNWRVGDEIWIPDTRQPDDVNAARQTEVRYISRVNGSTITLTAPVQHNHLGWREQSGAVGELFEVANVTQSIVFASENPDGTRGHWINMDHCLIDAEGYSLRDMGRTTTDPLHATTRMPDGTIIRIGDNQPGRYSDHDHGNPGRIGLTTDWQSRRVGYSIVGGTKWGRVLHHSTYFCLDENFAIVDCAGGGLVTETPNVYGNAFRNGVIIALTPGSGQRITDRAHRNLAGGDHWHDAVGLGLQSLMNEFTGISIYSCKESIGLAGFRTTVLFRPKRRGVHVTSVSSSDAERIHAARYEYPLLFPLTNVRCWGGWRGVETWTVDCYPDSIYPHRFFEGLEIIHCRIPTDLEDQEETYLSNWRILGDFLQVRQPTNLTRPATYGLNFKDGYRFGITMQGGEIRGYDSAYKLVHDQEYTTFNGVEVECPTVMYEQLGYLTREPCAITWTDCEFTPVAGNLTGINGWLPKYGLESWYTQTGRPERESLNDIDIEFRPWADGHDLEVYHHEQQASFALPSIPATEAYGDWPAGVNTQQQLIDLGTPIYGAAVPPTATQDYGWGRFWVDDVTPIPPSVEERLDDLERRVDALEAR